VTDRKLWRSFLKSKEKYYCQEIAETEKAIADIYNQKAKLLDLNIESNIDDDGYENKNHELSSKMAELKQENTQIH